MKILPLFEERQVDIDAFDQKFGDGSFKRFNKLKDRLKNNNISVDIVYHTKNTSVDDMTKLLSDTENRVVKDKATGDTKLIRTLVAENEHYAVYNVLDWETSMNMGGGTGWCIAGRYQTGGKVKPSQAKEYFNKYKEEGISDYLFFMPKKSGIEKYCMCVARGGDFQFWTSKDDEYPQNYIPMNDTFPEFEFSENSIGTYNGISVFGETLARVDGSIEGNITIPDGVKKISRAALQGCRGITSIELPSSLEEIGNYAFYGCSSLDSIVIPNGVTILRQHTFDDCTHLKEITLPDNLALVERGAFENCANLRELVFPSSVVMISDNAFLGCTNLNSITIPNNDTLVSLKAIDENQSFTVKCNHGSRAERFAKDNSLPIKYLD